MIKRCYIHSGGVLDYDPEFLSHDEADKLFDILKKNVQWNQNYYTNYRTGEKLPQPRLTAWYANDSGMAYSYSGITELVQPWLPELLDIKSKIENITKADYNSVLLNFYRDGKDSVGYHADDEKELGINANIASISLGNARKFILEQYKELNDWRIDEAHKSEYIKPSSNVIEYELTHGSLLVMSGTTQQYWKHSIPKAILTPGQIKMGVQPIGPRINLTFRKFFKV